MPATFASSRVEFLSRNDGMQKISTSDEYTRNLTRFDLMAKIQTLDQAACEADYLRNCRQYVREWTTDEIEYISSAIQEADRRMCDLQIRVSLPDSIFFVATSGWEEGNARGYTRDNAVYLNQYKLSKHLVFHELFHIINRYNEGKRDAAYGTLHFNRCNDLAYDEESKITNPDAIWLNHFIRFQHRNVDTFGAIIIRSQREYTGGGFFSYVTKRLLIVEESDHGFVPKRVDGDYVFLDFSDASEFYSKIGRNTDYNIHQEEICAEHFVAIITGETALPDQYLITDLLNALQT